MMVLSKWALVAENSSSEKIDESVKPIEAEPTLAEGEEVETKKEISQVAMGFISMVVRGGGDQDSVLRHRGSLRTEFLKRQLILSAPRAFCLKMSKSVHNEKSHRRKFVET